MELKGFGKYLTFGLRKNWVDSFFQNTENWLSSNSLGNKQVDSVIAWLKDAEILNSVNRKEMKIDLTNIGKKLAQLYNSNENFVWKIIWINLSYNSDLVKWYISLPWRHTYSKTELLELLIDNGLKKNTADSGLGSLFNMFENSPLGNEFKIGVIFRKDRERYVEKIGTDEIEIETALYSLYKYAKENNRYDLTVSELYDEKNLHGIHKEFGVSKTEFEKILRSLQENYSNLVNADLKANLDNIHLNKNLNINELFDKVL